MVLILSIREDYSTGEVVKWLIHYNVPFLRINYFLDIFPVRSLNCKKFNECISYLESKVNCIWFRRTPKFELNYDEEDHVMYSHIHRSLYKEMNVLWEIAVNRLKDKYWLNHPSRASLNKIDVLEKAKLLGLKVPPYIITGCKEEMIAFKNRQDSIITKPLFEVLKLRDEENNIYMNRTGEVTINIVNTIPNYFFPSLFQKKIDKKFEVRSVFIENKIYSMAIFSQKSVETSIDFRNYNIDNPNRVVPIEIPSKISKSITNLMKLLGINFGSIDFIVDKNDDFIFLEINPVGQFGMTSTPNNYNIEREIALILKQKNDEASYKK